jgi:hypothetical protein
MQLIKINIGELKPATYNPRIESSKLDKAIIESIKAFGGSGSTLIAAAKLGRVCYTMEKDVKRFGDMLARLTLEGIQYERIR